MNPVLTNLSETSWTWWSISNRRGWRVLPRFWTL